MRWAPSAEVSVLLRPQSAYSRIVAEPAGPFWRRPLAFALLMGCCISLLSAGVFDPRIVGSETVTWLFLPLLQIAALAVARGRGTRTVPFGRAVDLFFAGFAPWAVWLIATAAFWSWSMAGFWIFARAAVVVALWSGYIDFCFFRVVMKHGRAAAWGAVLLQRAIAWPVFLVVFGGGSLLPEILRVAQ